MLLFQISYPFWSPPKIIVLGEEKVFPLPTVDDKFEFLNSVGLNYEATEVRRCLSQGNLLKANFSTFCVFSVKKAAYFLTRTQ